MIVKEIDILILKFQEHLPEYIEDDYIRSSSGHGWQRIKGNYDMSLCLSENQNKDEYVICPVCGKISDFIPDHGDGYKCGKCDAFIRTYGNSLNVWGSLKTLRKKKLSKIEKYKDEN